MKTNPTNKEIIVKLSSQSSLWKDVSALDQSKVSGGAKSVFVRCKPHVNVSSY
jgi:hypothetical protein